MFEIENIIKNGICWRTLKRVSIDEFNNGLLILPDNIDNIGLALQNCLELKQLIVPKNISVLPYRCLEGCENLEKIVFKNEFVSFIEGAFIRCKKLKYIEYSNEIKLGSAYCFSQCENLSSIHIGNRDIIIETCCFENCISLKEVVFSQNLKIIDEYAFYNCKSLPNEIIFPENLEYIEKGAFYGCDNIEKVFISKNTIVHNAFPKNVKIFNL